MKNMNVTRWSLPGGKTEKNESPLDCAKREIHEELGVEIAPLFQLGAYISQKEGKRDTISVFVAELKDKSFKKQWELSEAKWFDLDNLPSDTSPATSRRIGEYKNGLKDIHTDW